MSRFLISLLLSALLATCMLAQQFFPVGALSSDLKMDETRADLYSEELKTLREPSVWRYSHNSDTTVYRFLWLRAFHPPFCVRLDTPTGAASITLKEGQFHGAAQRSKLMRTKTSLVPKTEVNTFLADVAKDHFWTIPAPNSDLGKPDGWEWILEAADHGTYKVLVAYMASGTNPVRLLGLRLLFDIAHVRVPANSIY